MELAKLREDMRRLGVLDVVELEQENDRLVAAIAEQRSTLHREADELNRSLAGLRSQIVVTEETAVLQEAGIYQYRHPLSDSIAYRVALESIQSNIKAMARKNGGAIQAAQDWVVNGSQVEGRKMLNDFSKANAAGL